MSIISALAAINLVGKTVRPAHGTERRARASGRPRTGIVTDVHIRDLAHPYVIVQYGHDIDCVFPFELDVVPDEQITA